MSLIIKIIMNLNQRYTTVSLTRSLVKELDKHRTTRHRSEFIEYLIRLGLQVKKDIKKEGDTNENTTNRTGSIEQ